MSAFKCSRKAHSCAMYLHLNKSFTSFRVRVRVRPDDCPSALHRPSERVCHGARDRDSRRLQSSQPSTRQSRPPPKRQPPTSITRLPLFLKIRRCTQPCTSPPLHQYPTRHPPVNTDNGPSPPTLSRQLDAMSRYEDRDRDGGAYQQDRMGGGGGGGGGFGPDRGGGGGGGDRDGPYNRGRPLHRSNGTPEPGIYRMLNLPRTGDGLRHARRKVDDQQGDGMARGPARLSEAHPALDDRREQRHLPHPPSSS